MLISDCVNRVFVNEVLTFSKDREGLYEETNTTMRALCHYPKPKTFKRVRWRRLNRPQESCQSVSEVARFSVAGQRAMTMDVNNGGACQDIDVLC